MVDDNKKVIQKFFERVDTGDIGAIDDFVSPKYQDHNPAPFPGVTPDFDGGKVAFKYAMNAFSDFRHEIKDQIIQGDLVVTRVIGFGKHTGEFMGVPPTGKDIQMEGIVIHRVKDGKMVEHWAQVDGLGMLVQLGVLPPPA